MRFLSSVSWSVPSLFSIFSAHLTHSLYLVWVPYIPKSYQTITNHHHPQELVITPMEDGSETRVFHFSCTLRAARFSILAFGAAKVVGKTKVIVNGGGNRPAVIF